jgi:hypothetical protein
MCFVKLDKLDRGEENYLRLMTGPPVYYNLGSIAAENHKS